MGWPLAADLRWGSRPKLHGMQVLASSHGRQLERGRLFVSDLTTRAVLAGTASKASKFLL